MVTEVYTGERKWEELREGGRHRRERVCTELRPLIRREVGEGGREARGQPEARETERTASNNNTLELMFHKKLKLGRANSINHKWLEASFMSQMKSKFDLRDLCEFSRPVPKKPFVFTCS